MKRKCGFPSHGELAQLARASALQAECQGFKSPILQMIIVNPLKNEPSRFVLGFTLKTSQRQTVFADLNTSQVDVFFLF